MTESLKNNIEENEEEKQKKHIRKIYSENALKYLSTSTIVFIFSLLSYLIALVFYDNFDFGFIFEIISFISIYIAKSHIEKDDLYSGKKWIIISIIPVVWLLIYDFINLLANIGEVISEVIAYFLSFDFFFYSLEPYLADVVLLLIFTFLLLAHHMLTIADGTKKVTTYADRFYDEL